MIADRFAHALSHLGTVDQLDPETLVDVLTQLGALTERARARVARLAAERKRVAGRTPPTNGRPGESVSRDTLLSPCGPPGSHRRVAPLGA